MAAPRRTPIRDKELKGLKYFKLLGPLLDRLHDDATARDHAGNRRLFYDQYACLLLLFFFNPGGLGHKPATWLSSDASLAVSGSLGRRSGVGSKDSVTRSSEHSGLRS